MLQNLRDNSRGVISFILIGFLVIIFALTGVDALFNWDSSANQAAKVNGEKVTEMEVQRAISMQKQQMINQYGEQIPAQFLSDEYLRKPVIENLVQRLVLTQAATDGGMATSKDYLSKQIAVAEQFKDESGAFSNVRYQQVLRNMGLTHSTYTKLLSDELIFNQLQSGINATSFATPSQFEEVVALSFETRDVSFALIPAAKVSESVVVNDDEIAAHYAASPQVFTSPEQVAVDYIDLNVANLMKDVTVTEAQVRKQYEQNVASFVATPERQAAHILIEDNSPEKIKSVNERLASGEEFADVAKELSDDLGSKEQGGDLGFTKGDAFPSEFEAALVSLKVGEVSAPVKTDAGTHFIKLVSEKGSEPASFDEQKLAIEDQLKRAEAENVFVAKLEKLRDLSYNAESLEEVAMELDLKAENSGLFARNGGKDLTANTQFIEAAFSSEVLQEGNSSEVLELDTTRVVVLKKTAYKPSELRPLDEVKGEITAQLKVEKARKALAEQGNGLIAGLNSGSTLKDLSESAGLEVKELKGLKRASADVDADVLRYAFSMVKPQAGSATYGGVMTANGDFAVVVLDAVNIGTMADVTPEQKSAIVGQLGNIYGRNDFMSFQKFLKDSAEIK